MYEPYYVGLHPAEQVRASAIASAIARLQSNESLELFEHALSVTVRAVWKLSQQHRGGCIADDDNTDGDASQHPIASRARSIVRVNNPTDRWCLVRAICIGLMRVHNPTWSGARFRRYCADVDGAQSRHAELLIRRAGLDPRAPHGYGVADAERVQAHLNRRYNRQHRLSIFK